MLATRIKTQLSVCMHRIEKIQPHTQAPNLCCDTKTHTKSNWQQQQQKKWLIRIMSDFDKKGQKFCYSHRHRLYGLCYTYNAFIALLCVLVGLLIRDYISLIWVVFTHEIPHCSTPRDATSFPLLLTSLPSYRKSPFHPIFISFI